ncbi:MAG: rRNA maturation RNase YbeY [Ignavibacteria bacterium]|nr:rRNA maturation RNase YbeY [Ignavibacteria bacterium]
MNKKHSGRIEIFHQHRWLRFKKVIAQEIVHSVIHCERYALQEVNVIFVDDAFMKKLHKEYFDLSIGTDVISFRFNSGKQIEGEIYICLDTAQKQAKQYFQTYTQEVSRLLIHGTLHLLGYDDTTVATHKKMTQKENFYLQNILL